MTNSRLGMTVPPTLRSEWQMLGRKDNLKTVDNVLKSNNLIINKSKMEKNKMEIKTNKKVDQAKEKLKKEKDQIKKEMAKVKNEAAKMVKKAEEYMKKNPGKSAAISAGIGTLLGSGLISVLKSKIGKKESSAHKKKK
jgi:ElaB/YqjD/DUF883 family membrane-anchored ribosome-binding protein